MKDQEKKTTRRSTRQRYFNLVIKLGLSSIEPKIMLLTRNKTSFLDLLLDYNFVSQEILEMSLYNLKILDRGRLIFLQNFDGQLETDSQGIPYWNVYLQTTALITSRCVSKAISKDLFATKQSIDSTINIYSLSNFQQCQRKKVLIIPNSKFYPGHFSRVVIQFKELLKTDQVQEAIEKRPEILLLNKE